MDVLLQVNELKKYFPVTKGLLREKVGYIRAVDEVTFSIRRGETFGLVGESGCGKTTLARCILQLTPPTSGGICFEGKKISGAGAERSEDFSSRMQVVFQDPSGSLNQRHKIKYIVTEPLIVQHTMDKGEMDDRFDRICDLVGLQKGIGNRYPHMFSGGQRQRISIARAMIGNPTFVVCDEPVSSLDVSIKAQIINLLKDLQEKFHVSYLFISHDLSIVHYISQAVGVMYLGKIVEICPKSELYKNPVHPYTKGLLSAIPIPDPLLERKRQKHQIKGEVSSAINLPCACRFHPRCSDCKKRCTEEEPILKEVVPEHWVACHGV